jgi:glycosyltransferase involved in cell wall biosynthesis
MKIAFVITRADAVGGATIHVRDLSRALLAAGHQPTVLVGGTGTASRELQAYGIPVISLRYLCRQVSPWRDAMAVRELAQAMRNLGPDLISAHTAKAGFIARLACSGLGIPVLYTPHGWAITDRISRHQGLIYRMVERASAPLAARIVNVCEYERELALGHGIGTPGKHRVIHNGMPDIAAGLQAAPGIDPPHIVMVARFEAPKDHDTLVRALGRLQHLPWSLSLIGEGPLQPRVRERVRALGMQDRVQFAGHTVQVAEALAAAQIFVLASRSEAFPRSILEAMRAGLPVVASDVGGVREAVTDGHNGYVVPKRSVGSLAAAVVRLIADRSERERMGANGRRQFEQRFTFGRMLNETLSLYQEVTGMPVQAPVNA